MPEDAFQPTPVTPTISESELQTWAEQRLQRPRALQEIPLILVPPSHLDSIKRQRQKTPAIQSAIQTWLQEARLDDERLRIERRLIPHAPIYIPDTPEGQQFFKLAKAIADIPLNASILPKNQNQGFWFKTLHYYWQAKGVVLAQQLLGVIADPLGEDEVLKDRLSDKNLKSLQLSSATDIACFHLLTNGEKHIKRWAKENQIDYSFETPCDLFLALLKEDFLVTWQLGPGNSEKETLSKAKQRDNLAVRVRLLRQSPWLKETGEREAYDKTKQGYFEYLREAGWSGYWLLALLPYRYYQQLELQWESYIQAFSEGKELAVDTLDWLRGQPFHRSVSNFHRSVEGTLDLMGYIYWYWV